MPDLISPISIALLGFLLSLPLLLPRLSQWTGSLQSTLKRRLRVRRQPPSEIVSLRVYPIKSCRGFELTSSQLRMHGLELDRNWMLADASTREFLTIRQIPEMTLINTGISDDGNDLVISIKDAGEVRIPLRPSQEWLAENTTLEQVKIWDYVTDGYVYGPEVNGLISRFLNRDLCLVYKGPTPRIMQGNGDPRLLGREQNVNFPDVHPVLIASMTSMAELNSRLGPRGADPITIERFRPNIIIKGNIPWTEDSWKLVRVSGEDSKPLDLDVVARCARCQVPNVDPDTAVKHPNEPWDTLVSYRRIDEGIKYKPCFGMLCAPRDVGVVKVGMKFEVLEETDKHRYIKGF